MMTTTMMMMMMMMMMAIYFIQLKLLQLDNYCFFYHRLVSSVGRAPDC